MKMVGCKPAVAGMFSFCPVSAREETCCVLSLHRGSWVMTRAAWTWMTSCQQRGDCHPCHAGPQSLRCQAWLPSCFVRPVFWRPGTGCELVTHSDVVSHVNSYLQSWGWWLCHLRLVMVAVMWPRLVTSWRGPRGTMATRPQSSSRHQENNLFVSRHLSGVGCKSELFTTLLLPLPTFTWIEYMETYKVQTTLLQFNVQREELIWIQSLQSYPILSRSRFTW